MPDPNALLRVARERTPSRRVAGTPMSREELADEVVQWIARHDNGQREVAFDANHVGKLERGVVRRPRRHYVAALSAVLGRTEAELGFAPSGPVARPPIPAPPSGDTDDDELAALELQRRIAASDVGDETLTRLETVVDELATAYPRSAPVALLRRIRQHLHYVSGLLDARMTHGQRQRLLTVAGWLSLLGATVDIDLKRDHSATARLRTAASLARHVGQDEIHAWCYETEAWRALTTGDYRRTVDLSLAAQHLAPPGSSAAIQATAQEGRAQARLGQAAASRDAIARVHRLIGPLPRPDAPEHHYRYDPDKSVAYTATTLAWLGDRAAERYAREVIARLSPPGDVQRWPRRVATAHLDLALTLLITDELDEACAATARALASGRVVPSSHWRAREVVQVVQDRGLPEATTLRAAYEELRRA